MPQDLTEVQFEELHARLRALRTELQQQLESTDGDQKPVSLGLPIGRLTRMDAMQQQSMAKSNRRDNELRLGQVRAALEAVESGEFGTCVRCEEPVGYGRLHARPEARLCLPCQEALERSRR